MTNGPVLWITGAGGFIGTEVGLQAVQRGYRVIGIGHGDAGLNDGMSAFVSGSLNAETLDQAGSRAGVPHAIIHLAGGSSVSASLDDPEADRSRTVGSTRVLCDWLGKHAPKARLVAASSAAVYGAASEGRLREDTRCNPQSPYGQHKLQMEGLLCDAALRGQPVAIIRLFSVIGVGLRKQLFYDLARRAAAGENPLRLAGNGEETRDYISRSDSARLLLDAVGWASSPALTVNGGTGTSTSIRTAAEQFSVIWSTLVGRPLSIDFNGVARPGDPRALVADTHQLSHMGFKASTSLPKELELYIQWFQRQAGA